MFASPAKKKGPKKQFKGRCGYCGEIGHKAAKCPDKKGKKKEDSQDKSDKKRRKNLRKTAKERAKLICQKFSVLIVEKWIILPGTVRNRAKTLI